MAENSGPRDDHSIKRHNGFSASPQRPIYIHITLYTRSAPVCVLLEGKGKKHAETDECDATQHIRKSVKNAPIQSRRFNLKPTALFTSSKSKYGSVEPPNGRRVAELILCDTYYMALLSHFLF